MFGEINKVHSVQTNLAKENVMTIIQFSCGMRKKHNTDFLLLNLFEFEVLLLQE